MTSNEYDDSRRIRTVTSTATDGLDLTVEEARAMSREEFRSVFGLESLDDVPVVAPGNEKCLDRVPRGARWYVYLRPAPKSPEGKDRKRDAFQLVVKP